MSDEWGVHRCACADSGMVMTDSAIEGYAPCARCNPEGHERWRMGKYKAKFSGTSPAQAELATEHVGSIREALHRMEKP